MSTPTVEIPEMPELVEQPNFTWRVKLPDEYISGKRTPCWLSGPTLKDGEWVWMTQQDAYRDAVEWWTARVVSQCRPVVTKQPREVEPWYVADRRAGYKFHD